MSGRQPAVPQSVASPGPAAGFWSRVDKACGLMSLVSMAIAAVATLVVASIGAVDVVSTALFRAPLPLNVELSSYLMSLMIFGALALAQRQHEHVAVDLVTKFLPQGIQRWLRVLGLAFGLAVFALLAWRSYALAVDSVGMQETAAAVYPFPVWPFKIGVTVLLGVATCEFLRQFVRALVGHEWVPDATADQERL